MNENFSRTVTNAKTLIKAASEARSKFVADLDKDAQHALEWAQALYDVQAKAFVWQAMLNILLSGDFDETERLKKCILVCNDQLSHTARDPHRSTSITANLWHQALVVAWANAADWFRWNVPQ